MRECKLNLEIGTQHVNTLNFIYGIIHLYHNIKMYYAQGEKGK